MVPCDAPEVEITVGRSVIAGTPDCPMPAGPMTLVVMSHGSGGSFLGHHDTARALAEAGFVVAALNHTGDNALDRSRQGYLSIFSTRPREIRRLIDYMTGAWPGRAQLRSDAVGFFGFSRGGYTGLVLAGAAPDFSQGLSFCESQPGLPMCRDIAAGKAPVQPYPKDVRVKALVIADPLNAFAPSALAGVAASVQLWASEQGGDGVTPASVEALRQGLPAGTDFRRVAGAGHFAFVAPCSQAQADALPSLCTDGPVSTGRLFIAISTPASSLSCARPCAEARAEAGRLAAGPHGSVDLATTLRRYTELPYLIDYLQSGELALLNPKAWDDRNDSFYIEEYARARELEGIYALCLAEAFETYHHWRVFSNGSGGVCIEFDKDKLIAEVADVPGLRAETVQYRTIKALREQPVAESDLPFLKRHAFRDEKEFRLFVGRKTRDTPCCACRWTGRRSGA